MKKQAILFVVDTQGTGFLGCYSKHAGLGTPNVDRLAAEGIRFDQARTTSPVCGPARSALFTGLPPHANGVLGNNAALAINCPTIGQRLSKHGLECGYIGKWHLDGLDYFGDGRCPPGWNPRWWFDGRNYLESLPDEHARSLSRKMHDAKSVAANGIASEFTHAHRSADRAIAFLRENRDRDFFLVVSIDEPHHPFICPEPFVSAFDTTEVEIPNADDSLENKPRQQREWAASPGACAANERTIHRREGRAFFRDPAYFACNSYSDSQVGRVLEVIDDLTPRALCIYTTDHGDMFGHHRLLSKGPAMYDEITRVPFIVRWPGHAPAGSVSAALVSHLDIVPTILDFFGINPPPVLPGHSLLSLFRNTVASVQDHVFIEFNRFELDHDGFGAFAPIRCVFDGRWKLAVNLLDTDELYDLESDPYELVNRISDPECSAIRDRLHDILLERMGATRDPLRGPHWGRRTWRDIGISTWEGPTRPRPDDPDFYPTALNYITGKPVDRAIYAKE